MSSSHSRSGSDIETSSQLSYLELLSIQIEAFERDFDYDDVSADVKKILPSILRDALDQETATDIKLWQLFGFLTSNETIIPTFLEKIGFFYSWIEKRIEREKEVTWNEQPEYVQAYVKALRALRSEHPKHIKYNVRRASEFKKLRKVLLRLKPHKYESAVLFAGLGMGKKWLAIDVCQDYEVMRHMNFKIFWLDVSKCNSAEEDLHLLQRLSILLQPDVNSHYDSIQNKKLSLQKSLKERFEDKQYEDSLLVLLNVQNKKTLSTFNLGCKRLVVTRNKKIVELLTPMNADKRVDIGSGLSCWEFKLLFEKYVNERVHQYSDQSIIYEYSDGNPYLLSIIGQNLSKDTTAWEKWIKKLSSANPSVNNNKFTTVIETSLSVLSEDELELFRKFAIFQHASYVPVNLLSALWGKSANDKLVKLQDLSIVTLGQESNNSLVCSLPFVYSLYLNELKFTQQEIAELHKNVVDYYEVEDLFDKRTDLFFCNLPQHDQYFFESIGYHLHKAGKNELLQKLYFDFGFMEQKIRKIGLLHTISDLKLFEDEAGIDIRCRRLLQQLLDFLPRVEVKLVESNDTCLLQYALWEYGYLKEEAARQIEQFSYRVWFTERAYFHQPRQIVNLHAQPKNIQVLEPDTCLITFSDRVILMDISLDYRFGRISIVGKMQEVRPFNDNNFVLTLDHVGMLKVWSIKDVRQRSSRRCSTKVSTLKMRRKSNSLSMKYKQIINQNNSKVIVAFDVEVYGQDTLLHVAYESGEVYIYSWDENKHLFVLKKVPTLQTLQEIHQIIKLPGMTYMLFAANGAVNFWDLISSSLMSPKFEWFEMHTKPIYHKIYTASRCVFVVFVFDGQVLRSTLQANFDATTEKLYTSEDTLTCAKLSDDHRYLILGTRKGFIVFDIQAKAEIMHRNVSGSISCIDIYTLDSDMFKYMILYGVENKTMLSMCALRQEPSGKISWAHNGGEYDDTKKPQLEPCVWLKGQKLYDIAYNGNTHLVATDSKNRIHRINTANTEDWYIWPEATECITAITTHGSNTYVGYENGNVMYLKPDSYEYHSETQTTKPITYLQLVNQHILVASAADEPFTFVRNTLSGQTRTYAFSTQKSFFVLKRYLMLATKTGQMQVLDANKDFEIIAAMDTQEKPVSFCCDYKNSQLFLVYITPASYRILVSHCAEVDGKFAIAYPVELHEGVFDRENERPCALAVANNASLYALGYGTGHVGLYKIQYDNHTATFLYNLVAHKSRICDMKFSPCDQVLVSCSDQLCFWSVTYVLNNPFEQKSAKRLSSRFKSHRPSSVEEVDAMRIIQKPIEESQWHHSLQYWGGKRGAADKPELLACIKFDGNNAALIYANEAFTQFNTIDDEGVYYHFDLLQTSRDYYYAESGFTRNLQEISYRLPTDDLIAAVDGVDLVDDIKPRMAESKLLEEAVLT